MSDRLFNRLAPFLQEYLFAQGWDAFRPIQVAAAEVILDSDDHLLLASATASGKTEAAFLPILSLLHERPSSSIGVLYIGPLKALINDQYDRLSDMLREAEFPVQSWHGDVSQSRKNALLKQPRGLLQITPESLESLLIRRPAEIPRLFADLRFTIIDEVHAFLDADRGRQIQCLLARIQRLTGIEPRRIGLSATLGDYSSAEAWLAAGTSRGVQRPPTSDKGRTIRLALESFDSTPPEETRSDDAQPDPALNPTSPERFVFEETRGKRCLVFTNSRGEAESMGAALRRIAARQGYPDLFHIHHGSIAAPLREAAENAMRRDEIPAVTVATVTLELGIDLGQLERIVQVGAPFSVLSFVQRLGRSGRRGQPSELWFAVREAASRETPLLPDQIPWELLQCIAIVQLYLEEKWIEPARPATLPYSLLYHQTMAALVSSGERTPAELASRVLAMPPFRSIPQDEYRQLLRHLIAIDHIERTPEGGLIVGLAAERIVNSYTFYAVFRDEPEYTVRYESQEVGSIQTPPPPGERFGLAGRTWEVIEVDDRDLVVFVKRTGGSAPALWSGGGGDVHTRILQRMRQVLFEDIEYPYLRPQARERLTGARLMARAARLDRRSVTPLGGNRFCLFPWMGSVAHETLKRLVSAYPVPGIARFDDDSPYYVNIESPDLNAHQILDGLRNTIASVDDARQLSDIGQPPSLGKFDELIPEDLLRNAYATDRLDLHALQALAREWR